MQVFLTSLNSGSKYVERVLGHLAFQKKTYFINELNKWNVRKRYNGKDRPRFACESREEISSFHC